MLAGASAAMAPLGADTVSTPTGRDKDPDRTRSRMPVRAVAHRSGTESTDFRFAAAVAGFAMLLPHSPHAPRSR
ncbi:MAG: DUF3520 domain-containing protein [Gemmatimonadetes bacterium]|nr:DUF3520 domain-containing protein [Gemmatimonadota bacterium]MYA65528.1 DUF3520 domain-containing protein [Gemmatimonadota bacterium]MYB99827.1 DUF3520 domain-containing protein [Gemmatimonadota bacterium]MYH54255.1 DUF3520 domain-containing protein [Gemmatimonadota bacterium]MYI46301.1 DUF3520 domain-containing protein [Gemmatimonadota bacterium]